MPDDIHITKIDKAPHNLDHAMEVTGVVNGQERRFRLDVPTFDAHAKQGDRHLREVLTDALRSLTDQG